MKRSKPTEKTGQIVSDNKLLNFFKNPWKIAFLTLIAIILGMVLFVGTRVTTTRSNYDANAKTNQISKEPTFQVLLKKDQINNILNFYLDDFMKKSGVDYSFALDNEAMLEGTFELLGHPTHFYLYFEPYVLTDGNVQLRAKNLSVGTLSIPISAMINYISHSVDFPDWVEVNADKQTITLHLDKFTLSNGMQIRADKINLIDDEISFSVYLNKKELEKGK
ncbi:hypothetical protein CBF34_04145 [Vagococcus penaei]|uniref:Uncharacterized protein n=1 Tax=Vagococcus penaei TaxID=633807 RepID=A0A1Q2D8K6_9ENTE|nr:YpmS family protein [Vagococcus penaei]AQP54724.1 hypothetical protein BW732_11240 [Vagococcus penaei]RSU05379.1 hypothetical protein CBF34_04145 [Vagococcus penaei]